MEQHCIELETFQRLKRRASQLCLTQGDIPDETWYNNYDGHK